MAKKEKTQKQNTAQKAEAKALAECRRARHDYFVLETFTAGMVLQGWEVKSARAGRAQINEAYVAVSRGEVFLLGSHFSPLTSAGTHIEPNPSRSRKLLLTGREISRLQGKVKQAGLTLVPLRMYLSRGKIKISVGLARGKKKHDRRHAIKTKQWNRDKQRIFKGANAKRKS